MLKTIVSPEKLTSERLEVINSRVDEFNIGGNGGDYTKKLEKLSKSQKLTKLEKKLSKNGNLPNFNAKKAGPNFLNSGVREAFNHLRLAFTEALNL